MAKRGGIESMSEFALIELLETGESMNCGETRETFERIIASKREAREKREADAIERSLQLSRSPAGQAIDAARRKTQELQDESKQFQADLRAAGKNDPRAETAGSRTKSQSQDLSG